MKRVIPHSESSVSDPAPVVKTTILEDDESYTIREPSAIAQELRDLQSKILRVAQERDRLPQPLFWSLFSSRLRDVKRAKELERLLLALGGSDV